VPYHLIVPREVSQAIGRFGLSRVALIQLLTTLRQELESHGPGYLFAVAAEEI
jgi:hypothetical protein